MKNFATVAFGLYCVAFAYPACAQDDWINKTLGCDATMDNICYKYAHRRAEHDAIEQRRRKLRQYAEYDRAEERRRERREELRREERREDRREEYREERREDYRQIVRYVDRDGRQIDIRPPERKGECLAHKVRRVGTEHILESNARTAAENSWSEEVRYSHGEKLMDLKYARNIVYTCSRSSTPEGVVNRVESAVGTWKTRCEIEARPCLPQPTLDK